LQKEINMKVIANPTTHKNERLTQAYEQAPWRKQLQAFALFLLLIIVAALVAGLYLSITARAATIGRNIQSLEATVETVRRENANLQSRLAALSASDEMEKRAASLGFKPVSPEEVMYLVVPGYPGRQPAVLAPANHEVLPGASVTPSEYTESLISWLRRNFFKIIFPNREVSR
jgi:cell division protein FtsL